MDRVVETSPRLQIERSLQASIAAKQHLAADDDLLALVETVSDRMVETLDAGGKLLFFGNGGSAADATHLATEFVGRFKLERRPLPALSLSDNVSSVTAIGNDYAFEEVFARSILAFGAEGDVAIGLTTSGASRNVLAALSAARDGGLVTVAITGPRGLPDDALADFVLAMPGMDTARIQECTMLVGHALCEVVEAALAAG